MFTITMPVFGVFVKHQILWYVFYSFLYTFKDDPKECKMVDCTKHLAEEICPKTCSEPKFCKIVDCTKPNSPEFCPKTCAERTKEDIGNKNRLICI